MEGQTISNLRRSFISKTFTSFISLAAVFFLTAGIASADRFDDQIAALQQEVNQQKAQAAHLAGQADTLANKLASLQNQTAALRSQINLNQTKYDKTTDSIVQNKLKLEQQKAVLSANIKSMYLDSTVTPIEMLASSKNISEFLDQQQYLDKIKSKIQAAMADIQSLQLQLEAQQTQLTNILSDQKGQQAQLIAFQNETSSLLASTRGQEAAYQAQAKQNNSEITNLRAQQAAVLAARFGGAVGGGACGGGYPGKWCNIPQDSAVDNWGMYNRECVSYTAFRVAASGRHMPYWGGRGNAKEWPSSARSDGIPVDGNPRAGDVAISMMGPYGHAMYVENVDGNKIHVSQYNYGNRGEYSEMTIPSSGLYFIHFR